MAARREAAPAAAAARLQPLPATGVAGASALRPELLRRAAVGFEGLKLWSEAAGCWAARGDLDRASGLYLQAGDPGRAAGALLAAGRHAEALEVYRSWESGLPASAVPERVRALLGQAACHVLGCARGQGRPPLARSSGQAAFRGARALIESAAGAPWLVAACWRALGEHGARIGRFDLLQEGYERALAHWGEAPGGIGAEERLAMGREYLAAVEARGDRLLARDLEERLARWRAELPEPGRPMERDFSTWKAEVEAAAGTWIQGFGIDFHAAREPEQFRHLFVTVLANGYFARGAIVTGDLWDRSDIPKWRAVHGYAKQHGVTGPGQWYCYGKYFTYLGPSWQHSYARLSEELHRQAGEDLSNHEFFAHP